MRAGLKPELCHIVGQLAQVCRLEGIMVDELRKGEVLGLGYRCDLQGGKIRWKRTRSGTGFRLLGQLVGHLVTVLIFVCVCSQKFGGLQTGKTYCKNVTLF